MTRPPMFYQQERVSPHCHLGIVHIPTFAGSVLGDPLDASFRREKGRNIGPTQATTPFFNASDYTTINRFKVLKKQMEWMAGKVAVKLLAADKGLGTPADLMIDAEKNGAPFLSDFPHISISISHSGDYAVAALDVRGRSLGLDIELIEAGRMKNIMRVAFSDREIARYQTSDDSRLYLNWTVKEAFLKYIKKGFAEGLKKVEILDGRIVHHGHCVTNLTVDSRILFADYAFTLITESE